MSLTYGPNLGLLVDGAAGELHYSALMKQWRGLDALVQSHVIDKDLTVPPVSPADGDCYIVAAGATGTWATHDLSIARYSSITVGWEFFAPKQGWKTDVEDEDVAYRYTGSAWAIDAIAPGELGGYGAAGGYLRSSGSAWVRVSGISAADVTTGTFGTGAYASDTSFTAPLLVGSTRVTSPLLGTTSGVDVVIDRNSVAQLTLGSLTAAFAGALTVTTTLTVGSGTSTTSIDGTHLVLDRPAGNVRDWIVRSSGSTRWRIRVTSAAEGGSNAGSDFNLMAVDDSGVDIDTPLTVLRAAAGAITFASGRTVSGSTFSASTRLTAPLIGTTTAVDVVFDRDSVAQLTLASLAATFAGTLTVSGSFIAVGTTPATAGTIRLPSGTGIFWRNAANNANIQAIGYTSGSEMFLGNASTANTINFYSGSGTPALGLTVNTAAFAGTVSAVTRITSPLHGTTTATDVIFDRNSVTQLTLGSLTATFAGSLSVTTTLNVTTTSRFGSASAASTDSILWLSGTMTSAVGTTVNGLRADFTIPSVATTSGRGVFVSITTATASFTMNTCAGVYIDTPTLGAGSTVTTGYGLFIAAQTWTGATTGYGIRIQNITGATTNYALFTNTGLVSLGDAVTMASTLAVTTSVATPLLLTTTAVDLVLQRNSVTQLTLGSLIATFAGTVTVSGASISVGTTPATGSGSILIPNGASAGITARNAANSANISLLALTSSNNLAVGGAVAGAIQFTTSVATVWQFANAGHLVPVLDATYTVGDATHRPTNVYVSSTVFVPNIDSGGAVDLVLLRNAVTQVTFSSLLASFAGDISVASGKVYKVNGTQVTGPRVTGYTAMTGSPDKATAYATGSVTLPQLAGRVAQLQADLTTHGMIGA